MTDRTQLRTLAHQWSEKFSSCANITALYQGVRGMLASIRADADAGLISRSRTLQFDDVAQTLGLTREKARQLCEEAERAKMCDGCSREVCNVGPWEDGRQLCGGCKAKTLLSKQGFVQGLERDLGRMLGGDVTVNVVDEDGLPVVPKGTA